MKAPQVIMSILIVMSLLKSYVHDGEPKGNYNAIATIIAAILEVALLNWGGFY